MNDTLDIVTEHGRIYTRAIDILKTLVSFPSLSKQDNNAVIGWVENYLRRYGAATTRIPISDKRWNLFATLGPLSDGGICLSGHLDVVPADEKLWHTPPFHLTVENGGPDDASHNGPVAGAGTSGRGATYYGRGTADMKGFIALVLAMVPEWAGAKTEAGVTGGPESRLEGWDRGGGMQGRSPVHLAFTYDEETGCSGAPTLVEELGHSLPKPEAVIVGEPTGLVPVIGHRGGTACLTEIRGLSAHSSDPEAGVNAIYAAADLVQQLRWTYERFTAEPRSESPFHPAHSTLSVGTISGGTARNVIPDRCSFEWELRSLPGDDPADILAQLDAYCRSELLPPLLEKHPYVSIRTTVQSAYPPLLPDESSPALRWIRKAGCDRRAEVVNFGTEAGLYQQVGIPAIVWGPGRIEQAHTNDEFIRQEQLDAFLAYLGHLV